MTHFTTRAAVLGSAAAACIAGFSTAGASTFTVDLPVVGALEDPTPVSIPQFNGDINDLVEIRLTLNSEFVGQYRVEELTPVPGNIDMQRDWEHVIFANDGGVQGDALITAFDEWTGSGFFAAADGVVDFNGPSGFTRDFGSSLVTDTTIDDTGFAPFVGAGTVDLFFDFNSFFDFTIFNGGQTIVIATADYSGSLTVDYVVPAPGSAALLAFGGLAAARRRR